MELRQLQFFLEVEKQQSFTKAAKSMFVAQPAISKSIAKLEQELGVILFKRAEKKVTLTPEGLEFFPHAKNMIEEAALAKLKMEELSGLEKGTVTLGLPSMAGSFYFPNIIVAFKQAFPHLILTVVEAGTKEIKKMIEEDEIDLGVIIEDTQAADKLDIFPFLNEEMVVCVTTSHPLAHLSSISYEALAHEPLILFKEGYYQRDIIDIAAKRSGITPNITFETNQISLTKSLMRQGLGITLFLKMVISEERDILPLSLEPPVFLQLALARKKKSYISKANQAFWDFFTERAIRTKDS